jgi:hypothetical protein
MRVGLTSVVIGVVLWCGGCPSDSPPASVDAPLPDFGDNDVPTIDGSDGQPFDDIAESSCIPEWSFERTEGGIPSSPVIASDGVAAVTAGDTFRRIRADGQEDCTLIVGGSHLGNPSQNKPGTYFMGTATGDVVAITKNCTMKWPIPFDSGDTHAVRHAPALQGNDVLFVLDEKPSLHRLSDLGDHAIEDWSYVVLDESMPSASPAYAGGESPFVVFASLTQITAVQATGSKRWAYDVTSLSEEEGWEITSNIALTTHGDVVSAVGLRQGDAHSNNQLLRLQADPTPGGDSVIMPGWPKPLALPLDTVNGVVIGADNSFYLTTAGHGILRLDSDGNELWRFVGESESLRIEAVPTLGDDGSAYFVSEPHFFYSVDTAGKQLFRYEAPKGGELASTAPAIHTDGRVLVHLGTQILAFTCTAGGPAFSSWPRYQRNNRASGNVTEAN